MRTSRLFAIGTLATSFAWLLAGGCSASDDASPGSGGPTAGSGGSSAGNGGGAIIMPDAATPGGGTTGTLNPLCGVVPTGINEPGKECLPDNSKACREYEPPGGGAGGGGGEAGAAGGESGSAAGGQAGAPTSTGGEGGVAGVPGSAGAEQGGAGAGAGGVSTAGDSGRGGEGGQAEPEPPSKYGCQLFRQNNEPHRQCELAGVGAENAPCFSSSDCAAGLGCVTEGTAGRCLRYCCSQGTECGAGTYCAERELRTSSSSEPVPVPVCVPADGCSLDEQYPCAPGQQCTCTGDTRCMLVRSNTTTCLEPGSGEQGDACPCAWMHLCSSVTNQCVKICHTDPSKNDCGTQKCQASDELPANFGVCVGPLK